jgi:MOSC domain-containing protein YiiM
MPVIMVGMSDKPLQTLLDTLPQIGSVDWIGVRPARHQAMHVVDSVMADRNHGLIGDRYAGLSGKRQVTLIQAEHLPVIESCLQHQTVIHPAVLRRNLVISGINLLALKDKHCRIGEAVLQITGQCHPCSRMEQALGPGGYNAMRGHGGVNARVIQSGLIRLGDRVTMLGGEVDNPA